MFNGLHMVPLWQINSLNFVINFTNDFSIVIQIWWKFRFIQHLHHFPKATATEFWIQHNRCAVLTCVKIWMTMDRITTKESFCWIWITMINVICHLFSKSCPHTVWYHYNVVNFLIAHPWGWGMECPLWKHKHWLMFCLSYCDAVLGLILDLRPANERLRYFVTTSLIRWAEA